MNAVKTDRNSRFEQNLYAAVRGRAENVSVPPFAALTARIDSKTPVEPYDAFFSEESAGTLGGRFRLSGKAWAAVAAVVLVIGGASFLRAAVAGPVKTADTTRSVLSEEAVAEDAFRSYTDEETVGLSPQNNSALSENGAWENTADFVPSPEECEEKILSLFPAIAVPLP